MKVSKSKVREARDPLIDEVRAIRADLSKQYVTLDGLVKHLQDAQRAHGTKIVSRKSKRTRRVG